MGDLMKSSPEILWLGEARLKWIKGQYCCSVPNLVPGEANRRVSDEEGTVWLESLTQGDLDAAAEHFIRDIEADQ